MLPKNDLVFQNIFGKPGNEKITQKLISLIIGEKIENLSLDVNKRLIGDHIDNKIGRLDVRAKLDSGEDFNIEIQVAEFENITNRVLYYWSKLYGNKLSSGHMYEELKPTICILITDYKLRELKEFEKYHTQWNLREKDRKEKILTPNIEIHILEIPKIWKYQKNDELITWLKFMVNPDNEEVIKMSKKDPILEQAMKELGHLQSDPDFQDILERRIAMIMDEMALKKQAMNKIKEESKLQVKLEIAKKMLSRNISIKEISLITDLSEEAILKINLV